MKYKICRTDELKHYGVVGMKWGVRKSTPQATIRKPRKHTDQTINNETRKKTTSPKRFKRAADFVNKMNSEKVANIVNKTRAAASATAWLAATLLPTVPVAALVVSGVVAVTNTYLALRK